MPPTLIEPCTPRLLLRRWRREDLQPLARMHADPEVMRYLPGPLGAAESEAFAAACQEFLGRHGWGTWALELRQSGEFAGLAGLAETPRGFHFAPGVEIRWRLGRAFWGGGLATEGAREALRVGFEQIGLARIHAFTALCNTRSQALMRRLGMRRVEEFEHPRLAADHPLRPHVLYVAEAPAADRAAADRVAADRAAD
ncbi:MAG: GNAT family N-acetyltransferase [Betaproteobacteria bacterium]|nr:GNAT family N-acetyltransferase [Betaproteobacteria bacterium]